jgi:hypothetical protein
MKTKTDNSDFRFFKKFKTYSVSEILDSGGTAAFARLKGHDSKKLYNLTGEPLSNKDAETALEDCKK